MEPVTDSHPSPDRTVRSCEVIKGDEQLSIFLYSPSLSSIRYVCVCVCDGLGEYVCVCFLDRALLGGLQGLPARIDRR